MLKGRGLGVTDDAAALSCLRRIGYYRLSAYWYPLRQIRSEKCDKTGKTFVYRRGEFQPDSSFEQVLSLYVFDKRLRLLVLDAIERIEVALRVDISYLLGAKDPFAHTNPELLHGNFAKKVNPKTGRTRHQAWLDRYQAVVDRSQEDFVKHYHKKYGHPFPIWVAVELWEFGMLSTFYQGMRVGDATDIAIKYGLPDWKILQSWLRSLNFVRNVAAHHSRLWNKNLVDQPKLPSLGQVDGFDVLVDRPTVVSRIFVVLCILLHFMRIIGPNSTWSNRLRRHLEDFPAMRYVSLSDMGFPDDWREQPLWRDVS